MHSTANSPEIIRLSWYGTMMTKSVRPSWIGSRQLPTVLSRAISLADDRKELDNGCWIRTNFEAGSAKVGRQCSVLVFREQVKQLSRLSWLTISVRDFKTLLSAPRICIATSDDSTSRSLKIC